MSYSTNLLRHIMMKNRIKGIGILFALIFYYYITYDGKTDIYGMFLYNFNYTVIPTIYAPVFLFNVYRKIKDGSNEMFITRFRYKRDIQIYNISEIIYDAVLFATIHNILFYLVNIKLLAASFSNDMLFFMILNFISHIILWTMYGSLFLMLSELIKNKIIVCIVSVFLIGGLFWSKAFWHTFVYSKYIYNIYDAVVIMPENFSAANVVKGFFTHIFIFSLFFYIAYRLYLNKKIYGEANDYENN